ncbi:hypothetical protein ACGFNU_00270 [Spirillospora sp. NPDC048911]|uniref:hypothetical protein n=1 Tax=Spirillospora sp. NPDC048911 TaxID=3364527 RepID=UPI00371CD6C8
MKVAVHPDRRPSHEAEVIAFSYHRLALDLARHLGRDVNNWYCYAVWASKAVSENLDLSPGSCFLGDVAARLNVPVWLRRPFRRVFLALLGPSYPLALALANRAIFLEMGSLAAELWDADDDYLIRVDETGDFVRRPEFLSALLAPAEEEFLDAVVRLFTKARNATGPERAEFVLGANIALVAYEQQRAQRLLELVLNRPPRWLLQGSWRWLWCALRRRPFHRLAIYTAPHAELAWPARKAERWWVRFYTSRLMVMRTPVGRIQLGRPLPPPKGAAPETVWAPIQDLEVRELVDRFLPSDFDRATAGVGNWLSFDDRMRFIVAYFRMYANVPELFDPPFTSDKLDELEAEMDEGHVPEPYQEWLQKENARRAAAGRGVRGLIARQRYRSPFRSDPDAAALAGFDLTGCVHRRTLRPEAGPEALLCCGIDGELCGDAGGRCGRQA